MGSRDMRARLLVSLLTATLAAAAACSGGRGGGGTATPATPTPPARPGFVVLRLHETLSIAKADGTALVDITGAPAGTKTLVGFAPGDHVLYAVATTTTSNQIWSVKVDGSGNSLLSSGVTDFSGFADASHLLVQKGPGPDVTANPSRDLWLVPTDGSGEIALATSSGDESFQGIHDSTIVFRRGPPTGPADLYAIPALGGAETRLTTTNAAVAFKGFTSSGRVVYAAAGNLFAIGLDGNSPATIANGPNPEDVIAIQGERIVYVDKVPLMGAVDGDLYAINSDGTAKATLAASAGQPESFAAITSDRLLFKRETSFMPPTLALFTIPLAGGTETSIGDISNGGIDGVDGSTIVYHTGSPAKIHAIQADGTGGRTLTTGTTEDAVALIVSGRVLFTAFDGSAMKLFSIAETGGTAVQLRPGAGDDVLAAVTPASIVVISIAGPGGDPDLVGAALTGGGLHDLAASSDPEQFRAVTPDGRIIYTRHRGSFLDDVYLIGGDAAGDVNVTDRPDADVYLGFLP